MMVVNEKSLEQLKFYLEEQLFIVLEKYIADGSDYVARMRECLQAGDLKALADLAHPLKSTSKQIGADAVAATAEQIELNARRGQDLDYADLIERLPPQLEQVEKYLRNYMAQ